MGLVAKAYLTLTEMAGDWVKALVSAIESVGREVDACRCRADGEVLAWHGGTVGWTIR